MTQTFRRMFVVTLVLAAAPMVLAGCGRKGDLDPPSMPVEQQNKLSTPNKQPVPDDPFVLDPLL
ncbi:lipoprotein [Ciceribacter sp. L1K23]|uniref:LPS translocon maturation chaperone LptM n=1 Tax=Ciceribacter sp. L1K23 TaxID=2820276 RepID=UPI001B8298EF|nr:lipoprotein [Ciceribacter sp. L1K23]MBR0554253.1 lipoprotein [Ciceribacter sp. L1K23]